MRKMQDPNVKNLCIYFKNPELALDRYKKFLYLLKVVKPSFHLVPTVDIDIFWHTHMLDSNHYTEDCNRYLGFFLQHDDKIGEAVLNDDFAKTCRLWKKIFKEQYVHQRVDVVHDTACGTNCATHSSLRNRSHNTDTTSTETVLIKSACTATTNCGGGFKGGCMAITNVNCGGSTLKTCGSTPSSCVPTHSCGSSSGNHSCGTSHTSTSHTSHSCGTSHTSHFHSCGTSHTTHSHTCASASSNHHTSSCASSTNHHSCGSSSHSCGSSHHSCGSS